MNSVQFIWRRAIMQADLNLKNPDHAKTDSFEHCSGRVACNKFKKMMDLQEQQIDILMGFLKPMMKIPSKPPKKSSSRK